ncbi:glycosyltransferase [Geodermatophilus sp. SYSU D01105]
MDLVEPRTAAVHGCYLDAPSAGSRAEAQALDVVGWVLGASSPAVAVEFVEDRRVVWRAPVDGARPDIASAFPDLAWSGSAGFTSTLDVTGPGPETTLHVRAVMPDQTRAGLAVIRLRRGWRTGPPSESAVVSVVIPCYNQAHFLPDAIESVLAQTHPHHEIVVVDDGSTDNTQEIVRRYPGTRCVRQGNAGLAEARNTGIRHSTGDYLVFLDADDRLLPDALRVGIEALRAHPESALVSGHYRHVGVEGEPLPTPDLPCAAGDHYVALLRTNYMGMPATALYRREVFEHVTGFDPSVDACADYDLNLRITRRFPVHCHEHVVAEYRRHGSNMSRRLPAMLAAAVSTARRQRRHVAGDRDRVAAYEAGMRFWQDYYGTPLAREVSAQFLSGRWGRALPMIVALARHDPRALGRLLRCLGVARRRALGRRGEEPA